MLGGLHYIYKYIIYDFVMIIIEKIEKYVFV